MLDEQIETLRARVHDVTAREQSLLRSLRETISLAEDNLLQQVREIAAQHSARRAEVLVELESLAGCIGTFPRALDGDTDAGVVPTEFFPSPKVEPIAIAAGDWRRATSIIAEDENMVELLQANAR